MTMRQNIEMVQCWYMTDGESDTDIRQQQHHNHPEYVTLDELKKVSGVLYWKLDVDNLEEGKLDKIRKERNYSYSDIIEISLMMPNYEEKIKMFFKEHLHADEEIRLVLDGYGYFDVRDMFDKWIRIRVEKGDLIVLPAGIYHRFTMDKTDYIKVMRLFVGDPVWTAINRPADDHFARVAYLAFKDSGFED